MSFWLCARSSQPWLALAGWLGLDALRRNKRIDARSEACVSELMGVLRWLVLSSFAAQYLPLSCCPRFSVENVIENLQYIQSMGTCRLQCQCSIAVGLRRVTIGKVQYSQLPYYIVPECANIDNASFELR